jgi:predicted GNAT superfamily acetyltransferase
MRNLEKIVKIKGKKFLLKVEISDKHEDYLKYEELRNEIWDYPEDNLPGSRNMMCENFFHEGSSLFIAVYKEDEKGDFSKQDSSHLVGFSYGFVGVKDKKIGFRDLENLWFYSQYTGVKENYQHYGLGILIKEFQKEKLIDLFGIYLVTCTYDPLTGVNAYRNIHYFGMEVLEYRVAAYGEFGGRLNREDVPCDRFFMLWDLRKKVERPDYDLDFLIKNNFIVLSANYSRVKGKSGEIELEIAGDVNLDIENEFLLIEIPYDFYQMLRETDIEDKNIRKIPLDWRLKTRQVFLNLFKRGYKIIDFRKVEINERIKDFYVLKKYKVFK